MKVNNNISFFHTTEGLSYGDYVKTIYNKKKRIIGCIENTDELGLADMKDCMEIGEIAPLPLTKNWIYSLHNKVILSVSKEKDRMAIQINSKNVSGTFKLRYVHELQHILRLIEE